MSWQEELRRLDAELAQGKLSKLQYTAQREELLAKASSEPATKPSARRPHPTKTPVKPSSTVSASALLTTARPTSAPSPADERSTDTMPHPPPPPPRPAPPPVPAPPPLMPQRSGPRQDGPAAQPLPPLPQVPPEDHSRGAVRAKLFVALGAVVAIALIVGGVWWMSRDGDADTATPAGTEARTTAPTTTTTEPPQLLDRLPELPGVLNQDSGTFTVAEGVHRELYGPAEAAVLKKQDVSNVTWKGSSRTSASGDAAYVVLVVENENPAAAKATDKALRRLANDRAGRIEPLDRDGAVPTFKLKASKSTAYFVIYPSDRYTVLISSGQTPAHDDAEMRVTLADMLTGVTETLVPGE